MRSSGRHSNQVIATVCAAIGSSVLTFVILVVTGWVGAPTGPNAAFDIGVMLSIVLIWAPAFALVPASILGFALERPLSRQLIVRSDGGFFAHLLAIEAASLGLWLLLRIAVVLSGPQTQIIDVPSLALFAIVGFSSALSWWFLVVLPGRRINAEGGLQ